MVNSDLQVNGSIAADEVSYFVVSVRGPDPTFDLLQNYDDFVIKVRL